MRRLLLFCAMVVIFTLWMSAAAFAASCEINDGDEFATDPDVEVSFSAFGAEQFRISSSSYMSGSWYDIGFGHPLNWGLSGSDGKKYVYMEFREGPDDNYPDKCNDSITLDTTPPVTRILGSVPYSWVKETRVSLMASDSGSGIDRTEYAFSPTGWWRDYLIGVTVDDQDESTLYYRSVDKAGNVEETRNEELMIDSEGPRCQAKSVTVKRRRLCTISYYVADDRSTSVKSWVKVKNGWSGSTKVSLHSYYDMANQWKSQSFVCNLNKGSYTIVVTARDEAGNWQTSKGTDTLKVR